MQTSGEAPAISFSGCDITYRQLGGEVSYWQQEMLSRGVKAGDRIGLLLYDSPEFVACFLAAVGLGAIAVPINTFLPRQEVEFILRDCQATLTVIESELEEKLDLRDGAGDRVGDLIIIRSAGEWTPYGNGTDRTIHFADSDEQTPAFILYTSGSTGMPKGALHRHGSIPFTIKSYSEHILNLTKRDRLFSASRLFFAYGLGNSLSFPLAAGAGVILDRARPTPEGVAETFAKKRPTVFFGVPAVYNALLEYSRAGRELDTSSLRLCISAGEALPARVFEEWQNVFGLTILDGIGSTEMLHIFLSNREGEARAASSGRAVAGYEARLLDENWNEVERGEMGNLWVKGGSATLGYWGRQDLTEAIMRDGWIRTGDIYRADDEGYFYHIGRSDDCFKVSGLWVSPIEVESVLLRHEEVRESAVVSGKDEDGLATVNAYIVIRTERSGDDLRQALFDFLRTELPKYKVPSRIEFLDGLPRTSTGKVQRFKLRSE